MMVSHAAHGFSISTWLVHFGFVPFRQSIKMDKQSPTIKSVMASFSSLFFSTCIFQLCLLMLNCQLIFYWFICTLHHLSCPARFWWDHIWWENTHYIYKTTYKHIWMVKVLQRNTKHTCSTKH